MTVMYEHIATQGNSSIVIDAARSVGNIPHDHGQGIREAISVPSILIFLPAKTLRTAR